jgi:hypothetical protein
VTSLRISRESRFFDETTALGDSEIFHDPEWHDGAKRYPAVAGGHNGWDRPDAAV